MRMIEASSSMGQLRGEMQDLMRAWSEARLYWNDGNAENIEENHLNPIAREMEAAFRAIHELNTKLMAAQRECEPR